MNKTKMDKLKKGSYTVETVVIMGVTFLLFSAILYMCSFLCGRAIMTAAAYEEAFTEREYKMNGLFGFRALDKSSSFDDKINKVSYQGICDSVWGGFWKEIYVDAEVKKISPVTFLWSWQEVTQTVGEKID